MLLQRILFRIGVMNAVVGTMIIVVGAIGRVLMGETDGLSVTLVMWMIGVAFDLQFAIFAVAAWLVGRQQPHPDRPQ